MSLDRAAIDPDADRVVRKLNRAGHKAYLVGGCVRDLLVGKKPKDFDVATSATPNEIKATFRNSRIIGRRFRLVHVVFGSKIIETATFRANPREDEDQDLLIRRDNVFGSETEDALRRDFTINGLFYDVEAEKVIDHVGGLADLELKLMRTIGDPDVRFQEDPVRMLRAIKFAARLDFGFEPATYRALLRWRGEISKCAPPRLLEEVHRLMRGGAARRSFELLVETGALAVLSPYLAGLLEGDGSPVLPPPISTTAPRATVQRIDDDELVVEDVDIDDPDDDDDDDGDDEATPVIELDPEERKWHQLWADEPIAPPSAAPVHLAFLPPTGNAMERRRRLAWSALGAFDRAVAEGKEPSNAVAFGVLLAPFVPDDARAGDLHTAINDLASPMILQLHVTRRDSERLRYLLIAQKKLAIASKRGVQAELAGGREAIDDALLLYETLERAAGHEPTAAPVIAPQEGRDDETETDANGEPRKRRRRRRGGRRRRHDQP